MMEDDDTDQNEHTLTYWYSVDSRGNREPVMPAFGPKEEAAELAKQKQEAEMLGATSSQDGTLELLVGCLIYAVMFAILVSGSFAIGWFLAGGFA